MMEEEPSTYGSQVPYVLIDTGPRPLTVRIPTQLLAPTMWLTTTS